MKVAAVFVRIAQELKMQTVSDQEIKDFQTRIATGMTTAADVDLLLLLIKQIINQVTGNDAPGLS